jgi:hypothetical protein
MTNRLTLKTYFKKGSKPTEGQFAEFIDSTLNFDDDAILKLSNDPLSIKAKAASTDESLINFYSIDGTTKTWQLKQKSGDKKGLSISYDGGKSLLFIDDKGNVGIGLQDQDPSMDANHRSLAVGRGGGGIYGISQYEGGPWIMSLVTEGQARLSIKDNGNVGIGTDAPSQKLTIQADYTETIDAKQLLIKGHTNGNNQLGLGYHTTENYGSIQAITQGTIPRPLVLNPGGGNVGIGTTDPKAKLDVDGQIRSRSNGFQFPDGSVQTRAVRLQTNRQHFDCSMIDNEQYKDFTIQLDGFQSKPTVIASLSSFDIVANNGEVWVGVDVENVTKENFTLRIKRHYSLIYWVEVSWIAIGY